MGGGGGGGRSSRRGERRRRACLECHRPWRLHTGGGGPGEACQPSRSPILEGQRLWPVGAAGAQTQPVCCRLRPGSAASSCTKRERSRAGAAPLHQPAGQGHWRSAIDLRSLDSAERTLLERSWQQRHGASSLWPRFQQRRRHSGRGHRAPAEQQRMERAGQPARGRAAAAAALAGEALPPLPLVPSRLASPLCAQPAAQSPSSPHTHNRSHCPWAPTRHGAAPRLLPPPPPCWCRPRRRLPPATSSRRPI